MKALFISNDPTIFDAQSSVRARMRAYAAAIGELHILSVARSGVQYVQEGGLFLHPVQSSRLFRVGMLARRAHALIREQGIEVVSAQDPFEHGLAALRAVRGTEARLHIQVHTDFLSPWFTKGSVRSALLNRYRQHLAGNVLPSADGIRVVSERIKVSIIKRYGSRISEPAVIPIAVEETTLDPVPLPEHPHVSFALIAVGRLEPEKRIEDILGALAYLIPRYPQIGLFIAGEGRSRARLIQTAKRLNISEKIVFLGNRSDARALMGSAQAFIQASAYEGYGRTLVEAALSRVPIVTTNVGIVGDVFKKDEDVLAVPVADQKSLAKSIERLIQEEGLRERLVIHAENAAHAHLQSIGDVPNRIATDLARTIVSTP